MQVYDFVIIGGGAAAFAAATKANELQAKTLMVNAGLPLGGTCINVGCVPSKHLLAVGHAVYTPTHPRFRGIQPAHPSHDFATLIQAKDTLLDQLRQSNYTEVLESLTTVTFLTGWAQFTAEQEIMVNGETYRGEKILIATGSSPHIPPFPGIETVEYLTNRSALDLQQQPKSLIIIGAGPVGLEFGQIFHHLGTRVTILQRSSQILSRVEPVVAGELQKHLQDEGIAIRTSTQVQRVGKTSTGVFVEVQSEGKVERLEAERLFLATGVKPNTEKLQLPQAHIATRADGAISVDMLYRTSNPYVFAAGDVIGYPYLETIAAKEGNYATQNALEGAQKTITYDHVPHAVFTSPEVAWVGLTEAEYMQRHHTCSCRTVYLQQVPKALAVQDTRGVVKMVRNHINDKIAGVQICAPLAADMIHEATLAVKFGLTVEDLIDTVHIFPTFSEAIKLAAQAFKRDISKMSCCIE